MDGKLVRDNIPDIIRRNGEEPKTSVLNEEAYLKALDEKLKEEVAEYLENNDLGELADVLEVVRAIAAARASSYEQVEIMRQAKHGERGGFGKRIFLHNLS